MHWSRYVDLGIATILVPLSKVMPMAMAENVTLVVWPTLLLGLMVLVTGLGTRRILGPGAAIVAMCTAVLWQPMGTLFFGPGRIDHHNVQMLTTAIMAFALIGPGPALRRGLIAGVAAAFSLAVGLETLPLILVTGAMLLIRSAWEWEAANGVLVGFCLSLVGAEAVLFLGQTDPRTWMVPHCDVLAPPVLAVSLIAGVACLVPMAARAWLRAPVARFGASLVLAGAGIAAFAPLLTPCLAGPYGALPLNVQKVISTQISEALPGLVFAAQRPMTYNSVMTPIVVAVLVAALLLWTRRKAPAGVRAAGEGSAVGQMLAMGCVGLVGSFIQIRMINLTGCAVPFLAGYVLTCLWQKRLARPGSLWSLALVAGVLVLEMPASLNAPALAVVRATMPPATAERVAGPPAGNDCRNPADLAALNQLPEARILVPMNLATPMIATTHHMSLSAPYHRSAAALWNGIFPFRSAENMITALRSSKADYVVLCGATDPARAPAVSATLLRGEPVAYLQPVTVEGTALKVFKVLPDVLAAQP